MIANRWKSPALASALALALTACSNGTTQNSQTGRTLPPGPDATVPDYWPKVVDESSKQADVEARVNRILADMTLEQKVAQLIQPEIRDVTPEDMRRYGFGSYLNGGGAFPGNNKHATPQEWVALAEAMYQASIDDSLDGTAIPTMWGTDAVHGHNNVIGATLFPHNIGLGAMNDPELITRIAGATAEEVRATGIDWIFAPTVAVARDDRWGRTYESYSEDPDIVGRYARAIVTGLQGDMKDGKIDDHHVISTVKHFLGDGGTDGGDDQGNNLADEETLYRVHAQGYVQGLGAGSQSVMASFNSWHGKKIHGSKYLLTNVLKDKMGFDGFVVGDWNGHGQIDGCSNESCPQAINAGLDIYMVPTGAWKPLYENTIAQVKSGEIPQSRLDDAVRRVLRVKVRVGLFDLPSPANRSLSGRQDTIGSDKHRAIAREAVRKSLVMLKNQHNLLPLAPGSRVLVAGDGADNIGKQSGGWTITWQGTGNQNSDFPGATSIYEGIRQQVSAAGGETELSVKGDFTEKPDVAIVVFGENPYAEGNGDLSNVEYQRGDKTDLALLKKLQAQGIPVVSVFITGRPLWINPELNASDAFVVAWLPGSEGAGVADVLFTDAQGNVQYPMHGKLSFSWPASPDQNPVNKGDDKAPLFAYGYGLEYGQADPLNAPLSEDVDHGNEGPVDHAIYVRTTQKPWSLQARSNGESATMNSNVLELDGVSIRTTDREVQEDALHISWQQAGASVGFFAPFPEDLRDYSGDNGALHMLVKLDNGDASGINVSLGCGEQCNATLPLQPFVKASGEWQEVTLPTQCFTKAGGRFADVFSPLSLSSQTITGLSISDVRLVPAARDLPDCP